MNAVEPIAGKAKTGIWGLDNILSGGFSRGHVFLVEGAPGTGKTTIALQFLLEGARAGEKCLYITLSETERELRDGAASHGWTLGRDIEVFELLPPESLLDSEQQQSLLYSSDLELGETTKQIFEAVERYQAEPGGARQPVRDQAAGAEFAALSAADSGDQALFREVRLDGDAARRSHRRCRRQDRAQRRAWRVPSRRTGAGLWRGTAARAHHQISRREIPRRLSRCHHHDRRPECVSAAGGVGISHQLRAHHHVQRH